MGEFRYIRPKSILNSRSGYTVKSDVWSLGISLVEVAQGKHPYPGSDLALLFDMVVNGQPPCLDENHGYCPSLENFLNKCLKETS